MSYCITESEGDNYNIEMHSFEDGYKVNDVYCHTYDMLLLEGAKGSVNCDWKYVRSGRWDVVSFAIEKAGTPYKAYRCLADRESGWYSASVHNEDYYFNVVAKEEVHFDTELIKKHNLGIDKWPINQDSLKRGYRTTNS